MRLCILAVAVLVSFAAWAGEPSWVGYRGPEGTGVFRDSNPPVDCDMKTGRNIRWRTPLPNWGNGSPLVIGGRAFVLSEPGWKHDWPVLTCLDVKTGKVLWEREVNHLPATGLPAQRQAEVAKQWHDFHATWRDLYTAFNLAVVRKKADEANALFAKHGCTFGGHRGGGYGQLRNMRPKPSLDLKDAGLRGETWHHGCGLGTDCIGMAFATPVSDGTAVWVTTTFGGAACYDFDGNPKWIAFVPPVEKTEAYARSPLLYCDLLVSDYFGKTVAFEKGTGKIRWTVETKGRSIATPAIITVGTTDILLTEGDAGGGVGVHAIRLPDGKALPVEGWAIGGSTILADSDRRDVAYFIGSGQHSGWSGAPKPPAAVRFTLEGDTLKATVLWHGERFPGAGGHTGILYYGNKVYTTSGRDVAIIDAASGNQVAGVDKDSVRKASSRLLPDTRHLLLLAGDPAEGGKERFYGLNGKHRSSDGKFDGLATLSCYSHDGKLLGQSVLQAAPVEGEKLEQIRSQVGWDTWPFAYGLTFTIAGDCLYVRSFDELICIGKPQGQE